MVRRWSSLALFLGVSVLAACGGGVDTGNPATATPTPSGTGTSTPTPTGTGTGTATPTPTGTPANACVSGFMWVLGDLKSDWMHPGMDCVGCHATNSGPDLWVGGTVYAADGQVDDCGGVSGATVTVTDANGVSHALTTNYTGNFFLKQADAPGFAYPYSVKVSMNGADRVMAASQTTGACNSCHTQTGSGGAPGRVLQP